MLATILKSPQATTATIAIIEAFAKLRELMKFRHTIKKEKKKGNDTRH